MALLPHHYAAQIKLKSCSFIPTTVNKVSNGCDTLFTTHSEGGSHPYSSSCFWQIYNIEGIHVFNFEQKPEEGWYSNS